LESISRRRFFKQAGGAVAIAGAAAVAPAAVASAVTAGPPRKGTASEPELLASEQLNEGDSIIAHVVDPQSGAISLFVGTREVLIHDRTVAARLVRATR